MADPRRRAPAVLAALLLTACGTAPAPAPETGDIADDTRAVQAAVDAVNATAAGPVAAQQAVLTRLVDPARAAEQAACAPATITIRIDPVLTRLTPRDGGTDGVRRYRLPALLEVYTGALRTGTDLTGLDLTVADGVAHTPPLCLR